MNFDALSGNRRSRRLASVDHAPAMIESLETRALLAAAGPAILSPSGTITTDLPFITWQPSAGATSYDLWIADSETRERIVFKEGIPGTSTTLTGSEALHLGTNRLWVRATLANGTKTDWGAPKDLLLKTIPTITGPTNPANPANQFKRGENLDPKQPWVNLRESYTLKVEFLGGKAALAPVVRPLPPYYLPQALSAMLPRLVPPNEPKGYMMATYVSDVRQVMMRYIDVEPEAATPAEIANATGKLRAIPIRDRIGYEGAPTIHWVTQAPDSKYLGSTTEL